MNPINNMAVEIVDPDFQPDFYTVAQAADYLSVSPQMVREYIRKKQLPCHEGRNPHPTGPKNLKLIDREDLVDFYARNSL